MENTSAPHSPSTPNGFFTFSAGPDKLRRNGKPMSCEPCRISKVKCDHTFPCKKCQSRGLKDKCTYKNAPMSKPASEHNRATKANGRHQVKKATRSSNLRQTKISSSLPTPPTPTVSSPSSRSPSAYQHSHPLRVPDVESSPASRIPDEQPQPGYLGYTSFASTFPGTDVASLAEPPYDYFNPLSGYSNEDYANTWRSGKEEVLLKILRRWNIIEKLVHAYYERSHFSFVPRPWFISPLPIIHDQLAEAFASHDTKALADLARLVTENSCKPFKIPMDTPAREFHLLYCGPNLRWEFLGSTLAVAGLGAMFADERHVEGIFEDEDIASNEFVKLMCIASTACRELCLEIAPLSDLMIWFLSEDCILQSNFLGDTSHITWRRFGDLISDLFALGFHRSAAISAHVPFYVSETRKRIWAKSCRGDKGLSTFLGRPPRISRLYSDFINPLDLDDDDLLLEGEELEAKIAQLDDDGWNKTEIVGSMVRPAAILRLRYHNSLLREEILELSLGGDSDQVLSEKLHAMKDRCHATWSSFPRWLRYDCSPYLPELTATGSLTLMLAYLEHLQSLFQVHRLLSRNSPTNLPDLFSISVQSLTTVMELMRVRATSVDVRHNFPWILMFHGLPAAGIIATELRRCALYRKPVPKEIPRAGILRTLAVLVPWFDWIVTPDSSGFSCNYKFCSEIVKMLSRTLDDILNHDPTAPVPTTQSSSAESSGAAAGPDGNCMSGMQVDNSDDVQVAGTPLPTSSQILLGPSSASLGIGITGTGTTSNAMMGGGQADGLTGGANDDFMGLDAEGIPMESGGFLNWLDNLDWENSMAMPDIYPSSSNPFPGVK